MAPIIETHATEFRSGSCDSNIVAVVNIKYHSTFVSFAELVAPHTRLKNVLKDDPPMTGIRVETNLAISPT